MKRVRSALKLLWTRSSTIDIPSVLQFQKSLANVEYDEYLSSQKSDISSIGFNLSQQSSTNVSSENSEASFQIEFSRRTRQQAKMKMTKQHFSEHRNDLTNKLKCHKETSKDAIGRSFVYSLLWLALNQIDDDLQLADLMRYAKESHIKQNNISSFLPPNMSSIQATNNFRKKSTDFQTHFALRSKAHHIARVINVRNIKLPDLPKLCARYVKELCLPPIIAEMAEKLIVFYPPHMKTEYKNALISAIPNFEGRAMAYIVFLLKLFFGLDDSREIRISSATQKINKTLVDIGAREEEILFVWSEWKEYIDMRNVILSQCHYPTALLVDPNVRLPVDLYVDFLQRINEDSTYEETYRKNEMENIRVIFDEVVKLHERQGGKRSNNSLHFSPSLTPFRSYMEQILDNTSIKSRIYIPAFMNVNHEKRDILAYLKPKRLKKSLRAHGLYVKVEELAYSEHVEFTNINFINTKQTENVKFSFDITKNEWIEMLRNRKEQNENAENEAIQQWNDGIKLNVDAHLNGLREKEKSKRASKVLEGRLNVSVTASSETDGNQSDIPSSAYQYFDEEEKDAIDDIRLKEPRRNLDQLPNILENVSSDEDEDERTDVESGFHNDALNEESVNFLVTNFDFWIAMENIYFLTNASFEEKFPKFPASFQWLLKQCAMHTHMHPKDLYIELLAIEAQFRYVLKPIFKMDNCIKFRDTSKLDAKTANAVRLLNRIW